MHEQSSSKDKNESALRSRAAVNQPVPSSAEKKIPAAFQFADRGCMIFAVFILPIVALKLAAESSYCPVPVLTILPRFSHLLETEIASPSGICIYEVLCVLIFIFRAMFMVLFGHILAQQVFGSLSDLERKPLDLFPNWVLVYLALTVVLVGVLLTTFDWGGRRETIKMTFLMLGLGGGFSAFTPGVVSYWVLAIRTRKTRERLTSTGGERNE